jgi:hypothetical protein
VSERTPIVVTCAAAQGRSGVAGWARRLGELGGAPIVRAPAQLPARRLLDVVGKSGAGTVLAGLGDELRQLPVPWIDPDHVLLLRRAPAPVLSVQPWADAPERAPSCAVVGVDGSCDAEAAARTVARLLTRRGKPGRLVLVHGCDPHPDELAAHWSWRRIRQRMRLEAHVWLSELADRLQRDAPQALSVDVCIRPTWAPDLIAGVARRENADFTALGLRKRTEAQVCLLPRIHRRVLLGSACPMWTVSHAAAPEPLAAPTASDR